MAFALEINIIIVLMQLIFFSRLKIQTVNMKSRGHSKPYRIYK